MNNFENEIKAAVQLIKSNNPDNLIIALESLKSVLPKSEFMFLIEKLKKEYSDKLKNAELELSYWISDAYMTTIMQKELNFYIKYIELIENFSIDLD